MAFQIFNAILALSVARLLNFLEDLRACRLCPRVVSIHVVEEYRDARRVGRAAAPLPFSMITALPKMICAPLTGSPYR